MEPEDPSLDSNRNGKPEKAKFFPVYGDVAGQLGLMQLQRRDQPAFTNDHTDRPYGPYFEWPRDKNGDITVPNKKKTTNIYPNYGGDVPVGVS